MKVMDTSAEMLSAYEGGHFSLERWKEYIGRCVPGAGELNLAEMRETVAAGYSWEEEFLPVLDACYASSVKREEVIRSFHRVTDGLDERSAARFGRTVDADIVLYLGLCVGAGWVTPVNGRTTVLLGMEKILELDWGGMDAMTGLIVHELGHVYHSQYGNLDMETGMGRDAFIWQLFTEGIAMVFEQEVVGDPEYFHQDTGGWKEWCRRNAGRIREAFFRDLDAMTDDTQRYFGDWVQVEGHGDTGYYLGTLFVRFLLESDDFDRLVRYGMDEVRDGFMRFMQKELD